jgi:hypothetical protein
MATVDRQSGGGGGGGFGGLGGGGFGGLIENMRTDPVHAQSRVITITLKSLSSLMSYCPSLHLASSTSK